MCFIITDFMYYFNHRALHGAALWPLHAVHHEPSRLDLFVSSRNTLWTNGLFVYLWVDGAWWFLLADPRPLAAAMATSAGLDLWRHSRLDPPEKIARWLRPWLILPADHERHHGHDAPLGNLGANLKVWDRLFGTLLTPEVPARTGRHTGLSLWRAWLWPFARP
jgi:sterol desaturase/sphingolipid hydroxylase (fatty acid hydroxylase superfamily)